MHRKSVRRTTLVGLLSLIGLLALSAVFLPASSASAASPLSMAGGFYVNPDSAPAAWVSTHSTDSRAAAIRASIASKPIARWFGDDPGIGTSVASYVGTAYKHDRVPVLVAYNIPLRDACGKESAGGAGSVAHYRTWISSFAAGVGDRPAVVIIEPDALSDFSCLSSAQISDRVAMLKYAARMFQQKAPNTWAYLDAGHSGWVDPATMASRLRSAGVGGIRGFSLNVSNFRTTSDSVSYGKKINSALGGSAHFVIDTSRNGKGSNGEWCNPAGRKLGVSARTGGGADLLLWIKQPGVSDGKCGIAPTVRAGTFSPDLAMRLINGT